MRKAVACMLFPALVGAFFTLGDAGQSINNCPLPDDLNIVEPDKKDVPPKLALLSGIWEGNWGPMSVLFIVEKIRPQEAIVVYACSGRQMPKGPSIPPSHFRKACALELGEDGNYRIIMALSQGTNRLIQTDDPRYIRVVRDGYSGLTQGTQHSIFRKRALE